MVRPDILKEFTGDTQLDLINFTAECIAEHGKNRRKTNQLINWYMSR